MTPLSSAALATLRPLRDRFLQGTGGKSDYWADEATLALYDDTFAQRIAWKWEAVLGELTARGWKPRSTRCLDFACGTGIATRTVGAHWPGLFSSTALFDRSARAVQFAAARIPGAHVLSEVAKADLDGTLLLISHVLNELDAAQLATLRSLAAQAAEIIWVEAGTHEESRRLGREIREPLLAAGWAAIAPCPHGQACGMFAPENERHWCHSFARPPSAVFQDASWAQLARELGLDLRSLPYSFLVMQRAPAGPAGQARVIGHPREYKGHLKVLACEAAGVEELTLQKRDAPALWKEVRSGDGPPLYDWRREGDRVRDSS